MARRCGNNLHGHEIPLFRGHWDRDEEALCDLTAAVWSRLSAHARSALLDAVCQRSGTSSPPTGAPFGLRRESEFRVPGESNDRRLDFLIEVEEWGVIGIEAKRSQAEWFKSGPAKFPMYVAAIARQMSARSGGTGTMLCLTPEPVSGRDLVPADGVAVGGLTWSQLSAATEGIRGTETDEFLLAELRDTLRDAGLLTRLQEIDMDHVRQFESARQTVASVAAAVDAFLDVLAREAGLGLVDDGSYTMSEALEGEHGLEDPYLSNPYVCFAPRCAAALREGAGVAVVINLVAGEILLLAGFTLVEASRPASHDATRWLRLPLAEGVTPFVWQAGRVTKFSMDTDGVTAMDDFPFRGTDDDPEWRGLCLTLPLAGESRAFGAAGHEAVRRGLAELSKTAIQVLRPAIPDLPAPGLDRILAVACNWGLEEMPKTAAEVEREDPWGWTPERLADLFLKRCTDRGGTWRGPKLTRGRWPADLIGGVLYRGVEGSMCCGAKITAALAPQRKASCPLCGTAYWNRDIVAAQTA
ncbi:hypothetical protein LBMAG42_27660 [Deltaproteobacteria bacterium]|nr:hypothetical protein LBMAG42_27660 [Deltaproteobacteria bacterium]